MDKKYRLILFDVDGTLVTTKSGNTFRKRATDWQWLPGRLEKLRSLVEAGVEVAFATNQGGVAFGHLGPQSLLAEFSTMCGEAGIPRSQCYVCFTHPKASLSEYKCEDDRRKPGPGMLLEAMRDVDVLPEETLMIGDRPEDEQAARAAQCDFIWADMYFAQ